LSFVFFLPALLFTSSSSILLLFFFLLQCRHCQWSRERSNARYLFITFLHF
jgi:hypothetical protein